MATKMVGVRELRNQAPKLVQRAERGEHFVITRHGRAAAMLGPPTEAASLANSPRLQEWERERRVFERLNVKPPRKLRGQFVAISGGRLVDSDSDASTLFARVAPQLGGQAFFIGLLGDAGPVVDMPGFTIE